MLIGHVKYLNLNNKSNKNFYLVSLLLKPNASKPANAALRKISIWLKKLLKVFEDCANNRVNIFRYLAMYFFKCKDLTIVNKISEKIRHIAIYLFLAYNKVKTIDK